jgi:hypothetical protein
MNSTDTNKTIQTFDFTKFRVPMLIALSIMFVLVVAYASWSVFDLFTARLSTQAFEAGLAVAASVGVLVVTLGVVLSTHHMPTKGFGAIILIAWTGVVLVLVGLNTALRGGLLAVPDVLAGAGQVVAGLLSAIALIPAIAIPLTMRDATHYDSAASAASRYMGFVLKLVMVIGSALASGYFGLSRGMNPMLAVVLGVVLEFCFVWSYLKLIKANESEDLFDAWMWRVFTGAFGAFIALVTLETVSTLAGVELPALAFMKTVGEAVYVSAIALAVTTVVIAHIIGSFIDFKDVDGDGVRDWIIGGKNVNAKRPSPTLAKDGNDGATVIKLPKGNPDDLQKLTTRECAYCGKRMKGKGRAKYCGKSCKDKAYRARQEAGEEMVEVEDIA